MSTGNNSKKLDKMPAPLEPLQSKSMMLALKTIIMRDRDRKRQEEEMADKIVERRKQEQEKLRKKREAESLTLEQTKEQITALENKLVSLRGEKHDLFLQLKKVLNESESRRKQIKEQTHAMRPPINDYANISHPPQHQYSQMPMHGSHMLSVPGAPLHGRPTMLSDKMFKPQTPPAPQGIKRTRSPSPPLVELYPQHAVQQGHFPPGPYPAGSFRPRGHPPYTSAQPSSSAFISHTQSVAGAAGYPPHRQQATLHSSFTSGGQSNPSKYQATAAREYHGPMLHYPHDGQGDHFPQGYHGYPPGVAQASLDSSNKSSSYAEEHFQSKLQSQHLRPIGALPHQALLSQQVSHIQQAQNKGLPAAYQSRRKPESPVYGQKKPVPQPHGAPYQGSPQQVRPSGYATSQGHSQGGRYY